VDRAIDILEVEIPSMLIQPYVENSIKHGILTSNRPGVIKIEIIKQDTFLKCVIEDNGIGRSNSYFINRNSTHKSFGTAITQERLAAINALNNINLLEKVIDLEDENGNALGTRVEIYIPFI
jgi:two-component system LytT family sensor kinase